MDGAPSGFPPNREAVHLTVQLCLTSALEMADFRSKARIFQVCSDDVGLISNINESEYRMEMESLENYAANGEGESDGEVSSGEELRWCVAEPLQLEFQYPYSWPGSEVGSLWVPKGEIGAPAEKSRCSFNRPRCEDGSLCAPSRCEELESSFGPGDRIWARSESLGTVIWAQSISQQRSLSPSAKYDTLFRQKMPTQIGVRADFTRSPQSSPLSSGHRSLPLFRCWVTLNTSPDRLKGKLPGEYPGM
ncbi:uncharacterized protein LOC134357304 [Mobula hypostoma]|uniref:uncharacterized protein LOC134357304 n=1 Tax=Mobula hypostoma TaxID=723540 RepID=UPI002FC3BD51